MGYETIGELVGAANNEGKSISEIVLINEAISTGETQESLIAKMTQNYEVMLQSVREGSNKDIKSVSKLSGGDALKFTEALATEKLPRNIFTNAIGKALAVSEYNACMGRIVASPTAGSCGILPAVLISAMEDYGFSIEKIVMSLFTAGGVGLVIAKQATLSGAEGGCQAECGSAAAMAAAALTELMGGTPLMISNACAIVLKSCMGLVCDPVAGLVEVPCIKRNAIGAANAIAAATMAVAGIESVIPADEVIKAMKSVGKQIPPELRETSMGGLAQTPTAKKISKRLSEH